MNKFEIFVCKELLVINLDQMRPQRCQPTIASILTHQVGKRHEILPKPSFTSSKRTTSEFNDFVLQKK
jgi:hypothetical protein